MELSAVINFLKLLGVGQMKVSDDEDWVRCSCPLAPFTHFKGKDENPSFGVFANAIGESSYNCFTCGSGRIWDLLHKMNWTVGVPKTARHFFGMAEIFDEEQLGDATDFKVGGYYDDIYSRVFLGKKKIKVPKKVLDLYWLLEDSPYEAHKEDIEEYFLSRGIPPHILYEYGVRHDPTHHLIVFPMIDTDDEAYRLHVKLVKEKTFWYITPEGLGLEEEYEPWGRKDYWFGIQHFDPILPVILVESETDLLRLRALGVDNVLASCGPLNKWKMDRIPNRTIYLGFDSDQAGSKFTVKAVEHFKGRQLFKLLWDTVEVTYYTAKRRIPKKRPAKDAGDIETLEQFEYIVENKKPLGYIDPIPRTGYRDVWKS